MRSRGGIVSRRWSRRRPFYPDRNLNERRLNLWREKRNLRRTTVWRRKDEVVSIFVDNIGLKSTTATIRMLFERFGEVCDVFISRKKRANNPKAFGFVKMKGPRNAYSAINHMRGRWVDNSRIFVKEARFKACSIDLGSKRGKMSDINIGKGVENKWKQFSRSKPTTSQDSFEPIDEEKVVKVQVNQSVVEELERSLIGESDVPRSVDILSQVLTNQWMSISKVRDLGPYKFIITFVGKDDRDHVLSLNDPMLMQYFSHIYPWDIYQQGDTRRVWLEVWGIPPQVWSRGTCEKIAAKFGILVCCEANFENPDSFVTCRIMIDTNVMSYIADVLYLNIDEHCIGKSIYVREGSNLTTCYVKKSEPSCLGSSHQWDDSVSGKELTQVSAPGPGTENFVENLNVEGGIPEVVHESVDSEKTVTMVVEESVESEKTVTMVGDVNYDINEEFDLISRKRCFNANLRNPNNISNSEEDCPPGFQKILKTKKLKRKSKPPAILKYQGKPKISKNKLSNKARGRELRTEIASLNHEDSIENWSDDDFESDADVEEAKSRELGKLLGLGVGDSLSIDELLV